MTVIDIRSIFSQRNIELFAVDSSFVYYAEEKNDSGHDELFILEYNRSTRKERLITNYTLEDPTFVEHLFAFETTIVLVLENGTNSMWMIEIDKSSGTELNRRKIVCTGAFRSCSAPDSSHLLICMGPDEANAAMFRQYTEITGCECLCYLYDIKTNKKHFVKNPLVAKLGTQGIRIVSAHGENYAILLDPFADEDIKKGYYDEQRWINADIRDNIWLCALETLEMELTAGVENISKKCIASADIKALVRYMGTDGDKVFFRAKEFRTGIEKICCYDITADSLRVETELNVPDNQSTMFLVQEKPFCLFSVTDDGEKTTVKGIVNSDADLSYDSTLGSFITCMDSRYAVLRKQSEDASGQICTLYDSKLDKSESYDGSCYINANTLILY